VRVTSLGFRTDLALRVLEGAEVADGGRYLVIRTPDNPGFWWGNFILLAAAPEPGTAGAWLARFAAEFPAAQHVALGVDTTDAEVAIPREFLAAGLEPQHAIVLTTGHVRPPPHPDAEAAIRPLGSDADWRQSVDLSIRCLGARTLVIVADPADVAIRLYRACGFADLQSQLTLERPSA
jgi:hypothetical protein